MDQKVVVNHEEGAPGGTMVQSTMVESRMEAALMKENPSPFRKSFLRMYACIFVGYLCSATNGFDANTFGRFTFSPNLLSSHSIYSSLLALDLQQVVCLPSHLS
jgi:hypothetical protein